MKSRLFANPWPIAITAVFAVFFAGLVLFIILATTQHVDLVRPDYYEEEIRFQAQFDRVARASQMPAPAAVAYDSHQQCITVRLPVAQSVESGGLIRLYRPSDARLDKEIPLSVDGDGCQRIATAQLRHGLWKVRVHWTVAGQEFFVDRPVVLPARRRDS